jgi:hypothetical protein
LTTVGVCDLSRPATLSDVTIWTLRDKLDACGKSVNGEPDDWTEIESYHNDWDNDSVESRHDQVACSAQCLGTLLEGEVSGYTVQGEATLRVKIGTMDYGTAKALVALIDPSRRT